MLNIDLFVEMYELCRTCSDDHVSEYQVIDLMIDSAAISHMEQGERLFWFAHENGTHCNDYLQILEQLQEFYTDPMFKSAFTPIYVIDCVSDDDNYKFYPVTDLYN